jgi:hypothetical protein
LGTFLGLPVEVTGFAPIEVLRQIFATPQHKTLGMGAKNDQLHPRRTQLYYYALRILFVLISTFILLEERVLAEIYRPTSPK